MPASGRTDMKMNLEGLRKLIREEYNAIRTEQQLLAEGPIADAVNDFIAIVNDMDTFDTSDQTATQGLLRLAGSLTPVQAKRVIGAVPGWPGSVTGSSAVNRVGVLRSREIKDAVAAVIDRAQRSEPGLDVDVVDVDDRIDRSSGFHRRGPNVEIVQDALNQMGFNAGRADGIYGKKTAMAIRNFQAKAGLPKDGAAGPRTLLAMAEDSNFTEGGQTNVNLKALSNAGAIIGIRRGRKAKAPAVAVEEPTGTFYDTVLGMGDDGLANRESMDVHGLRNLMPLAHTSGIPVLGMPGAESSTKRGPGHFVMQIELERLEGEEMGDMVSRAREGFSKFLNLIMKRAEAAGFKVAPSADLKHQKFFLDQDFDMIGLPPVGGKARFVRAHKFDPV